MANKSTRAMSNSDWLSQRGTDGTLTFVNSGGSNEVAWSDTEPTSHLANANSQGQTYAQGTIHNIGGKAYVSSGYAVYDGAQNLIGYVAGDGTAFVTPQDENSAYIANTDLSALSASSRQALKDAAARLEAEGMLNGSSAQAAVDEMNANSASGRTARGSNMVEYEPGKYLNTNHANFSGGETVETETDPAGELRAMADEWRENAEAQQTKQIDFATQQGIDELRQAEDEAQEYYKTQQDQISADELATRDNTALYAELRGDKGGIGKAQYEAVANTAARNRQIVASAQTKLANDTARQISRLRAQGEFEKADALLSIAQSYLQQLMSIEQWAAEFGLETDKFAESVRQWEAEYQLKASQYRQELLKEQSAQLSASLAESGNALLKAGIMPNSSQLAAMGMDEAQAQSYVMGKELQSSKGSSATAKTQKQDWVSLRSQLYAAGIRSNTDAMDYLTQYMGVSRQDAAAVIYGEDWDEDYADWVKEQG